MGFGALFFTLEIPKFFCLFFSNEEIYVFGWLEKDFFLGRLEDIG